MKNMYNERQKFDYTRLFPVTGSIGTAFFVLSFIMYPVTLLGGLFGGSNTIECDFGGKKETRVLMDCDKDIEYQARAFSFKVNVLDKVNLEGSTEKKALREAGRVLELLKYQNQQLCKRWNACAISLKEYDRKSSWLMETFTSFNLILEQVKLSELDTPDLKKEFLHEILDWFKNTAASKENRSIEEIWNNIKNELEGLKGDIKESAREGALEGAKTVAEEIKTRVAKLETIVEEWQKAKLSDPISVEKLQNQIKSLKAEIGKKNLDMANILIVHGNERLDNKNYEGAILDYEETLSILPENSEASHSVYFNLGIALIENQIGDRETNLRKAIDSYTKLLPFYTKTNNPVFYAMTQINLGVAYWGLSEVRDKQGNLELAIKAYNESLKVCTYDKFPQYYAMTQMNLGVAYWGLSEVRDKQGNLELAIKAYNESLKVCTYDKFPQDYAMTQINLGVAYRDLSEVRDKQVSLKKAVSYCKEARKVFTKEAFPWYFIKISYELARTHFAMDNIQESLYIMDELIPIAEKEKYPQLEQYKIFYSKLKSKK